MVKSTFYIGLSENNVSQNPPANRHFLYWSSHLEVYPIFRQIHMMIYDEHHYDQLHPHELSPFSDGDIPILYGWFMMAYFMENPTWEGEHER